MHPCWTKVAIYLKTKKIKLTTHLKFLKAIVHVEAVLIGITSNYKVALQVLLDCIITYVLM